MNIYLIGYRGCGKSTVAPLVAELMGLQSIDSDEEIEILVGQPIHKIFYDQGEAGFRQWESTVIEGLAQHQDRVISLGGGAILDPLNRKRLKNSGKVIWLTADAKTLWSRISGDEKTASQRPKLTDQGGLDEVVEVLNERTPIYESCADQIIDVSEVIPEVVAQLVCDWIESS